MAFVFCLCMILLVYVYAGYPLLCALIACVYNRRVRAAADTPSVTIIISAFNEADCIEHTLRNKLSLDYPADRVEIIVVSDASDDGTDDIVRRVVDESDGRVRLIRQDPRSGKTSALNLAAAQAGGDLIVFSDANSLYGSGALRCLVEPFADPEVGYVTGRMVYKAPDGSLTGEGCSAYMRYENVLRGLETRLGSVVGVDGGIDAVRTDLYEPMRDDQQPDFILPLSVVERGYRVVYQPGALLYEESLSVASDEFRMRTRVTLRAWHALRDKAALLDPFRHGLYSWQLFTHKWLRYLAPVFQVSAFLSNAALLGAGTVWTVLFILQIAFYTAALLGYGLRKHNLPMPLSFPFYLCLLNGAAGNALIRFLRGEQQVTWTPRK
jgi:cellulose synthase/poly-beta-1,6-N-acetylglucosamine synthase-like glycosyltransferase